MMIDGSVCAQCEGSHAPLCTYETAARRVITTAIVLHPERKSIPCAIRTNTGTPKSYHFAQFENSSARLSAIGGVKSPQRHNVHGSRIRMHRQPRHSYRVLRFEDHGNLRQICVVAVQSRSQENEMKIGYYHPYWMFKLRIPPIPMPLWLLHLIPRWLDNLVAPRSAEKVHDEDLPF